MIYNLIKKYNKNIKAFEIKKFYQNQNAHALIAIITFKNNYILHLKDYCFTDSSRKYSYHFQDNKKKIIFRYDNAPHWKNNLKTYPYHKHNNKNLLEDSQIMNIEKVLKEIEIYLLKKSKKIP